MLVSGLDARYRSQSLKAEFRYADGKLTPKPPAGLDDLESYERNEALAAELTQDLQAARQAATQVRAADNGEKDLNPDTGIVVTKGPVEFGPRSGPASVNGEAFELRWKDGAENGKVQGQLGSQETWKSSFSYQDDVFGPRSYSREATLTVDSATGTALYEQTVHEKDAFGPSLSIYDVGETIRKPITADFDLKDGKLISQLKPETFGQLRQEDTETYVGGFYGPRLEFVNKSIETMKAQDNTSADLDPAVGTIRTKAAGTVLNYQPAEGEFTLRLDAQGQPASFSGQRSMVKQTYVSTTFSETYDWTANADGTARLKSEVHATGITFGGATISKLDTRATLDVNQGHVRLRQEQL